MTNFTFAGNDIVAYRHPRCVNKWEQETFLQKVLIPAEIAALKKQPNEWKDAFLWTMWTLKEAAYKLSCFLGNRNKFHSPQFFTHLEVQDFSADKELIFPVSNISHNSLHKVQSRVHYNGADYYGYSYIGAECIHSVVSLHPAISSVYWGIQDHELLNKDDYSEAVRLFAMQQLSQQQVHVYAIDKDVDGIPYATLTHNKTQYISLSHDQQFVAYAFGG